MNKGKYFKLKPSDAGHLKLDIKNFVIEHINLFAVKKEMEIIAKINNYDALNEIEDLREVINKKFDNEINLKIKFTIDENILDENLDKLIKFIIENYKSESKRHQFLFSMYEVHSHEKNIFVKLPKDRVLEQIKEMKVDEEIRRKIFNVTNKKFVVKFIDGNFEDEMKKIDKIGEDLEKTVEVKMEPTAQSSQSNQQQNKKPAYSNFRKKVPDMEAMGFDVLETINVGENIALEGEIFDLNITETRTGGLKVDFGITDHTDSITGRMFLNNKNDEVSISLGKWVKVTGKFDQDRFTQELYVMAQKVDVIESRTRTRVDNAEIKRVELHAHTNMSEMSSNIDAKALVKKAKEFGHKAVAVTDYGVAHAYPFAFKESSDDFKVIFGLEAYVVDDEQEMITRPKDKNIEEEI